MKFISLLTDFGIEQEYVGVCKAVILSICPTAVLVDISHNVSNYSIEEGAVMLKNFVKYAPVGIHVAVIDPGVGTERRGIAVKTERGDVLVGPDNGVLMEAADFLSVVGVHALENPQYRLETVSSSFHGRDVFAPAAAHIAEGVAVRELGRALLYDELKRIDRVTVKEDEKMISGSVLRIDRFGNIQLSIPSDRIKRKREVSMRIGEKDVVLPYVKTFGEVNPGELLIYEDSDGLLTVSQNQGDASKVLNVTRRMKVSIFKE